LGGTVTARIYSFGTHGGISALAAEADEHRDDHGDDLRGPCQRYRIVAAELNGDRRLDGRIRGGEVFLTRMGARGGPPVKPVVALAS
jgi:hypothetical protein